MEGLTEEERKALRGSKFAPLPPPPSRSNQFRLAHPGGPLKTNKAAALAKFLERKLQEPNGLDSIDPDLVELAVKNAKNTVSSAGTSTSGRVVRHVSSFGDSEEDSGHEENAGTKKKRKRNKGKKTKKKKGAKNVNQGSFGEGDEEGSNLQKKGKKKKKKQKQKK